MPNIGPMEIVLVVLIALVVLGPKKLPEAGRSVGRGIREFKDSISGHHDDEAQGLGELHRPVADDAVVTGPAAVRELEPADAVRAERS